MSRNSIMPLPLARAGVFWVLLLWVIGIQAQSSSRYSSIVGAGRRGSTTRTITARQPWITSGSLAGDCEETDTAKCVLATGCKGGSVIFPGDITSSCPTKTKCFALTIFEKPPYEGPSATNYGCRIGWPDIVYRQVDLLTSTPDASPSPSASAQSLPSAALSSPTSDPDASISGEEASDAPVSPSPSASGSSGGADSSSESKAWIAGAVVGPIAGIALIGGGAFLLMRRRRRAKKADRPIHELGQGEPARVEKYGQVRDEKNGPVARGPAELAGPAPVELPASRI